MEAAKQSAALDLVSEVADDLVTVSGKPMAETYGGDVDAITWVMQEMVNEVEVKAHDVSADNRKQVVEKVNQVRRRKYVVYFTLNHRSVKILKFVLIGRLYVTVNYIEVDCLCHFAV